MRKFIEWLKNLVFPINCVACGRENTLLCFGCRAQLKILRWQECPRCRKANIHGEVCCGKDFYLARLVVTFRYQQNDIIQKLVKQFKYRYSLELARYLRRALWKQVVEYFCPPDYIFVPVPLDKKRRRERGFNQAEVLLEGSGPTWNCLARKVNQRHQAGLPRAERLENVRGLFSLKDGFDLKGQRLLLIDDVATTCATLNECAKVLLAGGAKEVSALVLARGMTTRKLGN